MSFFVTMDNIPYTSKPQSKEIGAIIERLKRAGGVELDYAGFAAAMRDGYTWVPGVFTTGKTDDQGKSVYGDFVSMQVFALDFDNSTTSADGEKRALEAGEPGYLAAKAAIERCQALEIPPFMMYHTFNARMGWARYRLVFDYGEPITDRKKAEDLIESVLLQFPEADQTCKNVNRMFFGSPRAIHTFQEVWRHG